jgi:hypothetical protein
MLNGIRREQFSKFQSFIALEIRTTNIIENNT